MVCAGPRKSGWLLSCFLLCAAPLSAQAPAPLNESGQILVAGRSTPYLIRHLPVSSFPDLPEGIQAQLNRRGCLIPQTYEARRLLRLGRIVFGARNGLASGLFCRTYRAAGGSGLGA